MRAVMDELRIRIWQVLAIAGGISCSLAWAAALGEELSQPASANKMGW